MGFKGVINSAMQMFDVREVRSRSQSCLASRIV